jgi:hypothetical protein
LVDQVAARAREAGALREDVNGTDDHCAATPGGHFANADNGYSVNLLAEVVAESGDCEVHFAVASGLD